MKLITFKWIQLTVKKKVNHYTYRLPKRRMGGVGN